MLTKFALYFKIKEATKEVILNCVDIKISSATYYQKEMEILESTEIVYDEKQEKVFIRFPKALSVGKYHLVFICK